MFEDETFSCVGTVSYLYNNINVNQLTPIVTISALNIFL